MAERAAEDAGVADGTLLGDFLDRLATRTTTYEWHQHDTAAFAALGSRAADSGVSLRAVVDLYLSAAWRAWPLLPGVAAGEPADAVATGQRVLRLCDDAVAALAEGHAEAGRALLRREESLRREFVDDLLVGTAAPAMLLARAESYGLRLGNEHLVLLAAGSAAFREAGPRFSDIAATTTGLVGPDDVLCTTREGRLVLVLPPLPDERGDAVAAAVRRHGGEGVRVAFGRRHTGPSGVARSYTEARDALDLAGSMDFGNSVVRAEDVLAYQVLSRDRAVLGELVEETLGPLRGARGGARPLVATLRAYLESGGNTSATARDLHLSVRAVTYRLARVAALTGMDPAAPESRFTLHTAVVGARMLGWPGTSG